MYRSLPCLAASLILVAAPLSSAHGPAYGSGSVDERSIDFPDTAEHKTLVLDLHTHSVFSDGHVWPTVRVAEAVRDGLDGLAITEHLEFQPHLTDIPHPDRNRSFEEASRAAKGQDLTIIPGVEITRTGEPGHINAIFVKDANPLVEQRSERPLHEEHVFGTAEEADAYALERTGFIRGAHEVEHNGETVWMPYEDAAMYQTLVNYQFAADSKAPLAVVEAANEQGAFLFWNHPNFATVDAELNDFHKATTKGGLLHGVEIANGNRYYENAHRLALKHNLAFIGVSDVHELIAWDYRPEAAHNPGHRPVTLVLAEEDSIDGMRDALFDRRSIVYWKESLIGRAEHLGALLDASLSISDAKVESWGVRLTLANVSDAPLYLRNETGLQLSVQAQHIAVPPHGETEVTFSMDEPSLDRGFAFTVLNALVAPNESAPIELRP